MWFLRWTPFAIGHGISPLASHYLNYPAGINLMWNTWMPAVGLLVWPITALGGVVLADNVVTTAGLALAAFFAFLALRRYVRNDVAAAVGGLLYGFSPYMAAQDTSHGQMVAAAAMLPIGLLLLGRAAGATATRPAAAGCRARCRRHPQVLHSRGVLRDRAHGRRAADCDPGDQLPNQVRARARYIVIAVAVAAAWWWWWLRIRSPFSWAAPTRPPG